VYGYVKARHFCILLCCLAFSYFKDGVRIENNNNNNNNNNKTYIAPILILLFSSALKNKDISKEKKLPRLHKVYKVHELIKKNENNYVNTKIIKITWTT